MTWPIASWRRRENVYGRVRRRRPPRGSPRMLSSAALTRRAKPHLRCGECRMHRSLCICALLPRITTRTRVVLVLHQLEAKKSTNTGVLAARCLENSAAVYRGRAPGVGAADPLDDQLSNETDPLLLYPHTSATPLDA